MGMRYGFLAVLGFSLWAQVRIGIVAAPQATTAKGEMDKDYVVVGVATGVTGEMPFAERAAVGMDILASFAGWKQEEYTHIQTAPRSEHRFSTLQVPLYVRAQWLPFTETAGLTAVVGLQSDILLSARQKIEGSRFVRNTTSYSRFAGSLLAGLGFSYESPATVVTVDLRTAYSFINIKQPKQGRINPAWFILRIGIYFGSGGM